MHSFAVKHIAKEHGALISILKEVKKQPYSFTSKEHEARSAARGCNIYVIEVIVESTQRIYRLGYRYRAWECYERPGGAFWKDCFKFKNAAKHGSAEGIYFESSILIADADFNEWYKGETLGMTKIPEKYVAALEQLIADPANNALSF